MAWSSGSVRRCGRLFPATCLATIACTALLATTAERRAAPSPPSATEIDRALLRSDANEQTAAERSNERSHAARTVHFDLLARLLADDRRSDSDDHWLAELRSPAAGHRVPTCATLLLGQPAPDFALPDQNGVPWSLACRAEAGPTVLVFYLGNACSACLHHLYELSADLPRFGRWRAQVVAISGDEPESTRRFCRRFGELGFPMLSDPEHRIAWQYGAVRQAADGTSEPLHAAIVLDRSGRVRWAYFGNSPFTDNLALLYEVATAAGDALATSGQLDELAQP